MRNEKADKIVEMILCPYDGGNLKMMINKNGKKEVVCCECNRCVGIAKELAVNMMNFNKDV